MFLIGIAGLVCLVWIGAQVRTLLQFRSLVWSRDLPEPGPAGLPSLSVVIPACNEADHLEQALASILAQDYPDLRIVLVNDRSEDGTLAIMNRMAERDRRIQVVDIRELPGGWLGKVHALHRGLQASDGELVLFTDADVHFGERFLRKAAGYLLAHRLDHLTVGPEARTERFWQEVANNYFGGMFFLGLKVADLERPDSDAFAGIGAFNLVRRAALDRTPGFPWLKMEILDDVGLGLMVKRAGGRSGFILGFQDLWLDWYPSFRAMVRGLEKNLFGGSCRFSYLRLAWITALSLVLLLAPPVALVQPWLWWPRILGLLAASATAASATVVHRRTGRRWWPLFLAPAGGPLLLYIILRSGWHCFRHGGVVWRGTFYPVEQLRAGQRVKVF